MMKKVHKIANRIRHSLGADFMLPPAEKGGETEVWSPGKGTTQPASEWMAQKGLGPSEDELTDPEFTMDTIPSPGPPTEVSELGGDAPPKPPTFDIGDFDKISWALQMLQRMAEKEDYPDHYKESLKELTGRVSGYMAKHHEILSEKESAEDAARYE